MQQTSRSMMSGGLPDGSCVRRESHAQFCEGPEVQFLRPTHRVLQTYMGKEFNVNGQTV
jgi:hypothetical protein